MIDRVRGFPAQVFTGKSAGPKLNLHFCARRQLEHAGEIVVVNAKKWLTLDTFGWAGGSCAYGTLTLFQFSILAAL